MLRICAIALAVLLPSLAGADERPIRERIDDLASFQVAQAFSCSPRKTCGQMRSCEEACYYLTVCGDRARDRDNDGIPCESICGNRRCQ